MTWTINGVDPRVTYGLVMARVTGWQDDVPEKYPTIAVPGRSGAVRTSATAIVEPRRLVGTGTVIGVGATGALRIADARAKLDGLRALFGRPDLAVVFADRATQTLTADCEGIVVEPGDAQMVADRIAVTITLLAVDPYFYDTATTTVATNASQAAMPVGNALVRPVITYTGAVASPTFTMGCFTFSGNRAISLTIGTIAGDVLVIDCAARTITLNGVSRMDLLVAGDFPYCDPVADGVAANACVFTSGLAGGSCAVTYRKAWR